MKNKKAVELTMNTIIVAVMVLLVLAILAFLLVKNTNIFNSGTKCLEKQGICKKSPCSDHDMFEVGGSADCGDEPGMACCKFG